MFDKRFLCFSKSNASIDQAFETEMKLVNLFEQMIGHRLNEFSGMFREFEVGDGRADIVLFDLFKNYESNLRLGGVSPRWAYALHSLPYRKNFSIDFFSLATAVSKRRATTALAQYESLGFCKKATQPQTWIKIRQPVLVTKKIIAIEAKLKDWRRALKQATRYKDYAHQAWVLLDDYSIKAAINNLSSFIEINIGLASINIDGKLTIHFCPESLEPKSDLRYWQANAEVARRIKLGF